MRQGPTGKDANPLQIKLQESDRKANEKQGHLQNSAIYQNVNNKSQFHRQNYQLATDGTMDPGIIINNPNSPPQQQFVTPRKNQPGGIKFTENTSTGMNYLKNNPGLYGQSQNANNISSGANNITMEQLQHAHAAVARSRQQSKLLNGTQQQQVKSNVINTNPQEMISSQIEYQQFYQQNDGQPYVQQQGFQPLKVPKSSNKNSNSQLGQHKPANEERSGRTKKNKKNRKMSNSPPPLLPLQTQQHDGNNLIFQGGKSGEQSINKYNLPKSPVKMRQTSGNIVNLSPNQTISSPQPQISQAQNIQKTKKNKMHPSQLNSDQQQRLMQETNSSQQNSLQNLEQIKIPVSPNKNRAKANQITVKDSTKQITLANFEDLQRFLTNQQASQGQSPSKKQNQRHGGSGYTSMQASNNNLPPHQKNYVQLNQQMLNQSMQTLNNQQIPQALFQMLQQQQIQQSQQQQMGNPQKLTGAKKQQNNSPQHQNVTVYYQPTSISMPMSLSVMDNQYQQEAINMGSLHMVDMPGIHVANNAPNVYQGPGSYMTPQHKSKNVKLKDLPTKGGYESFTGGKSSKSVPNHPQNVKDQYIDQQANQNKLGQKTSKKNRSIGGQGYQVHDHNAQQNHPADLIQFNTQQLYNQYNHQVNGIPVTYKVTKKTEISEETQITPQYQISYQQHQHQDFPSVGNRGSKSHGNVDLQSQKTSEAINYKKTNNAQSNQYEKDSVSSSNQKPMYLEMQRQDLPRVPQAKNQNNQGSNLNKRSNRASTHRMQQQDAISSQGQKRNMQGHNTTESQHTLQSSVIMGSSSDKRQVDNRKGAQMVQPSQFQQMQQNQFTREDVQHNIGKNQANASQPQIMQFNQINENRQYPNNQNGNFLPPLAGPNLSQDTSHNFLNNEKNRGGSHYAHALSPQDNTSESQRIQMQKQQKRGKSLPRGASQIDSSQARNQVWGENTYNGSAQPDDFSQSYKKNTTPLPSVEQRTGLQNFAAANRRQEEVLSSNNDLTSGNGNISGLTSHPSPSKLFEGIRESFPSQAGDSTPSQKNGGPLKQNRQSRRESNLSNHIRPVMVQDLMPLERNSESNQFSPQYSAVPPNRMDNVSPCSRQSSSRKNQNYSNYESSNKKKDFRTSELTHIDINNHVIESNQKKGQLGQPRELSPPVLRDYNSPLSSNQHNWRGNSPFDQKKEKQNDQYVGQHLHTNQEVQIKQNRPSHQMNREYLKSDPQLHNMINSMDNEDEFQNQIQHNTGQSQNEEIKIMQNSPNKHVPKQLLVQQMENAMTMHPIQAQEIQRQIYAEKNPSPQQTLHIIVDADGDQEQYIESPERKGLMTSDRVYNNSERQDSGEVIRLQVNSNKGNVQNTSVCDNFGKRQNSQNPVLGYITASPLNSPYPNQTLMPPLMPNLKGNHNLDLKKQGMLQQNNHQAVTVYTSKPPKSNQQVSPQNHQAQRAHQLVQNSNAKITVLNDHGSFHKHALTSFCTSYLKKASIANWTPKIYRNGMSRRIMVGKETLSKSRSTKPIIIIHLEGTIGYFDENKFFYIRERNLTLLQALSHNFRIIALSWESKKIIRRMCKCIHNFQSSKSFTFDAVYVLKKTLTGGWLNISHILLDMAEEITEGHLEDFAASKVILVGTDNKVDQNFYKTDLREIFHCDREYFMGTKAPLLIRMQHARIRPPNSFSMEAMFQTIVSLLCSSSLTHGETDSMYSYNEKTSDMCIPMGERGPLLNLLPEKLKMFDKHISRSNSTKFLFGLKSSKHGIHFHKGFKLLSEIAIITQQDRSLMNKSQLLLRCSNHCQNEKYPKLKLDWLDLKVRLFQWPVPMKVRLERLTQKMLKVGAEPPTGKAYGVMCKNDEAQKRFTSYIKRNEGVRKHIRKYRMRYWASHQIEEEPLVHGAKQSETESEVSKIKVDNVEIDPVSKEKVDKKDNDSKPMPDSSDDDGSDENSSDIEQQEYNEDAPPIKYKMIDLKIPKEQSYGGGNQNNASMANQPGNKLIKIDCRNPLAASESKNAQKSLAQTLIDMCSKRQPPMMFQTIQAEHLRSAQNQQIESAVAELTAKLNEKDDNQKQRVQDIKKQYD